MPELSRFYGVRIKMYYDDHHPPHFHAEYGGDEAVISIDTLDIIAGELPRRALGFVYEWAGMDRTAGGVEAGTELGAHGQNRTARIVFTSWK